MYQKAKQHELLKNNLLVLSDLIQLRLTGHLHHSLWQVGLLPRLAVCWVVTPFIPGPPLSLWRGGENTEDHAGNLMARSAFHKPESSPMAQIQPPLDTGEGNRALCEEEELGQGVSSLSLPNFSCQSRSICFLDICFSSCAAAASMFWYLLRCQLLWWMLQLEWQRLYFRILYLKNHKCNIIVFVHSGCDHKILQTGWQKHHFSFTVWRLGSLRSKCLANWVSGEAHFQFHRWLSSFHNLTWSKRWGSSLGSLLEQH